MFIFKRDKKEHLEHYRVHSLILVPGKVRDQMFLETISKHMKDKKVNGGSEHGFVSRNYA